MMKLEIEVELPEDITKYWEVVRVGVPREGEYVITALGGVAAFNRKIHYVVPQVIVRRKLNPSDWWPEWLTADRITFGRHGSIGFHVAGDSAYWRDMSSLLDLSWIPENLKRSGVTIQNPWKGEQQ